MQDNAKHTEGGKAVNDKGLSLPPWFHEEYLNKDTFKDEPAALAQLLNSSRQDVYSALSLYQVPVKHAFTLMISVATLIGILFSVVGRIGVDPNVIRTLEMGAGILLIVVGLIGFISAFVITQYYKVYVSALLYAAQIHYGVGMAGFHWFKRLMELLSKKSKKKREKNGGEISKAEFIRARALSCKDSNLWFVVFLILLGILSIIFGSIILGCAPFSSGSV